MNVTYYGKGEINPKATIENVGTVKVTLPDGVMVSVSGNSVYVHPTRVTEHGADKMVTEIHNVNGNQVAMSFTSVDGTNYRDLIQ